MDEEKKEVKSPDKLVTALLILIILLVVVVYLRSFFLNNFTCQCNYNITDVSKNLIQAAHSDYNWAYFTRQLNGLGVINGLLVGSSMQPSIYEGNTLLEINMTPNYPLKAGEIVRYSVRSTPDCEFNESDNIVEDFVVHRIQAVYNPDKILIVGDNNDEGAFVRTCQIKNIIIGVLFT